MTIGQHDIRHPCHITFEDNHHYGSRIFNPIFYTTVYPKKYAHGFCLAVLCCGYTLTDFPISIRLTSLPLWQSNDCPSASKATLMNMDKYFMWIHYERLHNHNKAKHNKTVCIFLGIYCNNDLTRILKLYKFIYLHWEILYYYRDVSNHRRLDCLAERYFGLHDVLHYWAFVMGIYRWSVDSSRKGATDANIASILWHYNALFYFDLGIWTH